MYILEKIKKEIVKQINKALVPLDSKHLIGLGKKLIQASDLVYTPQPEFGDLSLPCFEVAKKLGKTPVEIAELLVSKIKIKGVIAGIKSAGPYVNFTVDKINLTRNVIEQIHNTKDEYGLNTSGKGKRVMIEYSNANTHKQCHIGHLRNICYGDAVNRILAANGYITIPVSYVNDFGIHVAKTLWAYLEFYKNKKLPENKGEFLGKVYERATIEIEKNKTANQLISVLMKKIEVRQGKEYKLWQKTRQWSINQFTKIYHELDVKFAHTFYESEFIDQGRKTINKLVKKGILKESQGAIIADLAEYNLGVVVALRSDGTALYLVADLPLAEAKLKKFKPNISIYVVDVRQSLYFKQLFKILDLLEYKQKLMHLGYEFVKLPDGMMSSRAGRVITYENLREQVFKRAVSETEQRHEGWSEKKIKQIAEKITSGALKFEMIKVGAGQVIIFDINKALRFDGYTAAYLQYTYARINSIIRKSGNRKFEIGNLKSEKLFESKEHELVIKLAKYPEAVLRAGENYDPSEVAKYLFELAQTFNDYYHSIPVLKAEAAVREARLALIIAVNQIIKNGLGLLGINVLKEM